MERMWPLRDVREGTAYRLTRAVTARAARDPLRHTPVAKAIDYMLNDWPAFALFLTGDRICLTTKAAEWALRGIALGRESWLVAGSDRGGKYAAFMYSLIVTAQLNNCDSKAWHADVSARIADIS